MGSCNMLSDLAQHVPPEEALHRGFNRVYRTLEKDVIREYNLAE